MQIILKAVKRKIPPRKKIISVFAVITFIIYGWTLYWFLHELPAWLNYLQLSEILNLYSYNLAVNFLESSAFLFFVIFLCLILPRKWLYTEFVYRGVALSLSIIIYLITMIARRSQILVFSTNMIKWSPVILFAAYATIIIFEKLPFVKKLVEGFADRATIFLYVNIPASILAIATIAIRNIRFN